MLFLKHQYVFHESMVVTFLYAVYIFEGKLLRSQKFTFFSTIKAYTYFTTVVNSLYFRYTLCWSILHKKTLTGQLY